MERMWGRVEAVVKGRGKKAEREKVEELLDRLLDITTCSHTILLCDKTGSGSKDGKLTSNVTGQGRERCQ